MKRIKRNSPAEEATIQRGIAADPDAAEWTTKDFAQSHLAADIMLAEVTMDLIPSYRNEGCGDG